MVSISSRVEVGGFGSTFGICGGDYSVDDGASHGMSRLRISHAGYERSANSKNIGSPLDKAQYINYDEDDPDYVNDSSEYFQQNMLKILHDEDEDWILFGFDVMPYGVRLRYQSRYLDEETVVIGGFEFSISIAVPVTNEKLIDRSLARVADAEVIDQLKLLLGIDDSVADEPDVEYFNIEIRRCFSGEYYAYIRRSGEPNKYYELWDDRTNAVFTLGPKNRFAKWLAKILFPYYYEREMSTINYQFHPINKTYLVIREDLPIIATERH